MKKFVIDNQTEFTATLTEIMDANEDLTINDLSNIDKLNVNDITYVGIVEIKRVN